MGDHTIAAPCTKAAFWNSIKDSENPDEFEAYLAQFPSGVFAGLAKTRLKSLVPEQKTAAVVAPPKPATPSAVQPAVGVFPDLKPGDTFKDCDACPEMVVIPAGTFMMGSLEGDEDQDREEGPQHLVLVSTFAMGKYEVTREEFASFVGETGHQISDPCWVTTGPDWKLDSGRGWRDPGFAQSGRDPVVCVAWQDATAYVAWLSRKTGQRYRLATESEWEYAARGGTATPRFWGNDRSDRDTCGFANVYDATGKRANRFEDKKAFSCDDGRAHTAPVGSYGANGFGLQDVLGNVFEWVEDCYNTGYEGAPTDGSPWTSGDCNFAPLRGGSWRDSPEFVRSGYRSLGNRRESQSHGRYHHHGFRVAKTLILVAEQKTAAVVAPSKPATPPPVIPAVGVFPKLKPGDAFKDCDVCPEMVMIPAGTFMMGSSEAERRWAVDQGGRAEWYKSEGPRHRVTIGNAFVLGKFEVTRDEFAAFAKETGHDASGGCTVYVQSKSEVNAIKSWRNPGFAQSGRDPVACVSWPDATAYVSWLSRKTGEQYRLPSESEWEYAARAGTETMRHWGDDLSNSEACGYDNGWDITGKRVSGIQGPTLSCDDGQVFTSPVGSYRANRFGLYDVLGNVGEWVEDCLHDSYADAPSDGSAWTRGECKFRVVRGGAWQSYPLIIRSAGRLGIQPVFKNSTIGFRVARTLSP